MEQNIPSKSIIDQLNNIFRAVMKMEYSLPCSQKPANLPSSVLVKCCKNRLTAVS